MSACRDAKIKDLLDLSVTEGWSLERLANEIWAAAVEWAGGWVDDTSELKERNNYHT